jgi:hypothetical protein
VLGTLVIVAFAVTLAMTVGNRLSDEALSVLAGAVCGVGAAIPTSLIILTMSRRREEPRDRPLPPPTRQSETYPPIVVVAPPAASQQLGARNTLMLPLDGQASRHFTVVGGTSADQEVWADERGF